MVILAMRQIQCWRESKFSKNPNFLGKSQLKNPTSSYLEKKNPRPELTPETRGGEFFLADNFFLLPNFCQFRPGNPIEKPY